MITTAFASWSAFWLMGGYAFEVWLSLGLTLLIMFGLWLHSHWQYRQTMNSLRYQQLRKKRQQQTGTMQ